MNLANSFSVIRVLLIPVFMFFLLEERLLLLGDWLAAGVFMVAAATDTLDGYFARSRDSVTVFGQFLDPLADKLLISAALVCLVSLERLSPWIAMIIIAREFAVSGLRMAAAAEKVVIPASGLGKIKTFSQIIAIVALILPGFAYFRGQPLSWYLILFATLVTVISGVDYFRRARLYLDPLD
ncbi:MAG TPA: CDP-diacylglycerol--glycerol-3-phosphate 3-phosphatidyltransferase, partial [Actinobacteria bacterium]|nr:CDP-diacylglycerol--glycerol-3-phosphate 3-phosphatidyltransferase [Actinomycetota bacterium]